VLSVPKLIELQRIFSHAVGRVDDTDNIAAYLNNVTALSVYSDSVLASFQKALSGTFCVCKKLVGEDFFNAMIAEMIRVYPSTTYALQYYGKNCSDFIRTYSPAESVPYLADMANFEWLRHEVSLSPLISTSSSTLADQLDTSQEKIIFFTSPEIRLWKSIYPLDAIFEYAEKENSDESLTIEQGIYQGVWRHKKNGIFLMRLSEADWKLLDLCILSQSLEELCEIYVEDSLLTEKIFTLYKTGLLFAKHK